MQLTIRRPSGKRLYAPSLWKWWFGLEVGVVLGGAGVSLLRARHIGPGFSWIVVCACVVTWAIQTVPLIVSIRKPGQPAGAPADPSTAATPSPPSELDDETADLLDRIKAAQFSTIRLKPGYDEEAVDTFLDKLIAVLGEGGRLDQRELSGVQFATTRMRPGYVMQDVDGFLKDVARRAW
jgi:DivIVA domain-containing protein